MPNHVPMAGGRELIKETEETEEREEAQGGLWVGKVMTTVVPPPKAE